MAPAERSACPPSPPAEGPAWAAAFSRCLVERMNRNDPAPPQSLACCIHGRGRDATMSPSFRAGATRELGSAATDPSQKAAMLLADERARNYVPGK